jgi:hypothetical protein
VRDALNVAEVDISLRFTPSAVSQAATGKRPVRPKLQGHLSPQVEFKVEELLQLLSDLSTLSLPRPSPLLR